MTFGEADVQWRTRYIAIPYGDRPNRNETMEWWRRSPYYTHYDNFRYVPDVDIFGNTTTIIPSAYEITESILDDLNLEERVRCAIEQNIWDNLQTARSVRKKNEDELSAGDTKLLDEYLHSFMQPGA